jgi:alpha-tubulin suppressor-like RCC1 family protein
VKNLDGILDISSYDDHTCAITDDDGDDDGDTVWCWGRNNYDQLGDASDAVQLLPVEVIGLPGGKTPVDVEAGNLHTCVLFADGTVWCWGQGARVGRITGGCGGQAPAPVPPIDDAVQLTVGSGHTCVLHDDGSVSCFGSSADGALGPRDGAISNLLPAKVIGVSGVTRVLAGASITCVEHADATAWCWGDNTYGQTGNGAPSDSEPTPVEMLAESDAGIDAAENNGLWSCALLVDTSAVCWGYFWKGAMGVNLSNHTATPVVYGSGDHTT